MASATCAKRMFKRPETVEEMQAIRAKARERSFADLAEADELESILFKSFVVAAEQMDAVELLRKDGNKSWTSKISSVRVGFWKAYEGWTNFAHPELLAKPQLPKAGKKGKSADEDDEPEEEYVPDLTWPTEPVAWRDLLVWKSSENYPLVRDTNITARHIMALFDEEIPLVDIMKAYPFLNMRDIAACQAFWDEEVPARKEYEEKYFDKQWMSPLHPEFVKAPSYPKTPKPPGPVVPGGAPIGNTNKNDGPMTLPTRRGAVLPAILLAIFGLIAITAVAAGCFGSLARRFGMAVDAGGRYAGTRVAIVESREISADEFSGKSRSVEPVMNNSPRDPARTAVFTGTFDPLTLGHLDVVRRGRTLFDHLIVGIGVNPNKAELFNIDERVALARKVVAPFDNVSVEAFEELTVQFVRRIGARVILRGVRTLTDMEYEFGMSLTNQRLDPTIETVFLMADGEYSHVSSTLIKQIARHAGESTLSKFVPAEIIAPILAKMRI